MEENNQEVPQEQQTSVEQPTVTPKKKVGTIVMIVVTLLVVGFLSVYFISGKETNNWCDKLPEAMQEIFPHLDDETAKEIVEGDIALYEQVLKEPSMKKLNITKNELCAYQLASFDLLKSPSETDETENGKKLKVLQISDLEKYIGEERATKVLEVL